MWGWTRDRRLPKAKKQRFNAFGSTQQKAGSHMTASPLEATAGFEPAMKVLQTSALPLGYVANADSTEERKTIFELATLSLARRCSTTEPLPHDGAKAQT
jgi:hypothetical protein